jgi:glycosyltransferase involved in cell wall biosynthesis
VQASLERLAVRRAAVVVATSRYSRERIVEAYGIVATKIVVVPELIDLATWKTERGAEPVSEERPPAVLTVAHMYPRKNLGTLLRAYALLAQDGIQFRGWIVGEGPCRRTWERLRNSLGLDERVEFLGTIPRRELVDRYRRASVFCLPSRQEGFGIVFLEAMANAVPIVAARAAAVPETVADGEVGLLADPDDPGELARHLSVLLTNRELRRAMGQAGRRRVAEYRADRVAELFLARIHAALALEGRPEGNALRGEAVVASREPGRTTEG